jgi:hypothetical protein
LPGRIYDADVPRTDVGVSRVAKGASGGIGMEELREEIALFRLELKRRPRWMMIINVLSMIGCAGLILAIVHLL